MSNLLSPILDSPFLDINYFEGRLLTARDLREQQQADRARLRNFGLAVGAGIIKGLDIELVSKGSSTASPVLKAKAGAAINDEGQVLELGADTDISLLRENTAAVSGSGLFASCHQQVAGNVTNTAGNGIYILVMSPASGMGGGRVPKIGLETTGVSNECGHRYAVEGVQFRLEALRSSQLSGISDDTRKKFDALLASTANPASAALAELSQLQNLVAYLCFGSEVLEGMVRDPFAAKGAEYLKYGAVDDLTVLGRLTRRDVPLGVMQWTAYGISFLDMWSVRRRPSTVATNASFSGLLSSRRQAESEAMFWQFQHQLMHFLSGSATSTATSLKATDLFSFLPPVGFVPLNFDRRIRGFNGANFFEGMKIRGHDPVFIEGAKLQSLIQTSFSYPPIDIATKELVWLYLVRQNRQPVGTVTPQPYLVFSSGHIPFQGTAQFDLNRWDYGNFL